MPPLRPVVFIVSFLGVFALLVSTIPAGLLVTSKDYRQPSVEDYFEGIDIQTFSETWSYRMNETGGVDATGDWYLVQNVGTGSPAEFGGHDVDFWYSEANSSTLQMAMEHRYVDYWIFPTSDWHQWRSSAGIDRETFLLDTEIVLDWTNETQVSYTLECEHFSMKAFLAYNQTIYGNVTEAWNYHGLNILLGIDFDDMATGINAWNLIGMIMFWQLPEVTPVLNIIISLPFWIAFGWILSALAIAFIRSLPFT